MLLRYIAVATKGPEVLLRNPEVVTGGTKVLLRCTVLAYEGTVVRSTEGVSLLFCEGVIFQ